MPTPRPSSALAPPPRSLLVPPGVSDFSKGTSGEKDRDKLIEALSREIEPLIEKQSNREPTPQERMLRDKILRETYEAVVITGHHEGRRILAAQAPGKMSRGNKFAKARCTERKD